VCPIAAPQLCGLSEPTTGDLGGYTGAKALCEDVCGSEAAHMCTGHEVSAFVQDGDLAGAFLWSSLLRDCRGWTSADVGDASPATVNGEPAPCSVPTVVACCG